MFQEMGKLFKSYAIVAFLILLGSCKSVDSAKQTTNGALDNSLLWKIEQKGNPKVSYLFGTIHLIPEKDYFFTSAMESAFKSADRLVLEIDMAELNDVSKIFSMMNMADMPGDTTLQDLLTADQYKEVSAKIQEKGIPIAFVERIKPLFISALLMQGDEGDNAKTNVKSYEFQLFGQADSLHMATGGIETIEDQMKAIDKVPLKVQAELLIQSLSAKDNDGYDQMVQLYKQQNIDSLAIMVQSQESGMDKYMKFLLTDRNERWISRIDSMMQGHSNFFAFGAGHLGGKEGVINLLRQNGFKVTAIK
jgi:uncharacterized protein YbaP (TraB family)